jgi:capsule polysaccharide export protein KpsE/RkpR
MEKMKSDVSKMEAQLAQWGTQLDELVSKAAADAKVDYQKTVADLKGKLTVARAKLDTAKAVGHEKWEATKASVESVWHELEAALKKLSN